MEYDKLRVLQDRTSTVEELSQEVSVSVFVNVTKNILWSGVCRDVRAWAGRARVIYPVCTCRLPWSKSVGHPRVLKTEHFVCINNISQGKYAFLWLPTGFGRSVICLKCCH